MSDVEAAAEYTKEEIALRATLRCLAECREMICRLSDDEDAEAACAVAGADGIDQCTKALKSILSARKAEAEQRAVAVDEAWLRSVGFHDDCEGQYLWINGPEQDFDLQYWPEWCSFAIDTPTSEHRVPVNLQTRGDVLDLLAALKIESEAK